MKATEIMIGDWVQKPLGVKGVIKNTKQITNNSEGLKGRYFIRVAYGDDGYSYAWLVEEDVRPIPLTPDILLANGFIFEPKIGYISVDGRINLDPRIPNYPRKWYAHIDNEDFQTIASCDLDYLHQLQNLLRICNIEKEWKL